MAADAAAAAALLSWPAKDLRTGSISLSPKALGEGRNILAIVATIRNCHKLSFMCGFCCRGMLHSITALMQPVFKSGSPQLQPSAVPLQVLCMLHTRLYLG